ATTMPTAPLPHACAPAPALHSLPPRRSSDLLADSAGTLFPPRPDALAAAANSRHRWPAPVAARRFRSAGHRARCRSLPGDGAARSEEHTSELQSRENLVCRLLLEKKNYIQQT